MRISSQRAHNRWHPDLEPVARVRPGEEVTLETRDGLDGQLTLASSHEDVLALDLGLGHPLTGPIYVEGAEPGDTLAVELLAYETAAFGVTCIIPGLGFLADLFTEPYLVKWEISGGKARAAELPGVAVPGDPFAGVIGVAPSHRLMEEQRRREQAIAAAGGPVADPLPERAVPALAASGLRTIPPRETGGNMDVRQLVAGSCLYLPVHVPGALVSIGDLHFAQGDGEVCGTGIEVAGAVTVRFAVGKGGGARLPTYDTPERRSPRSFATTGIAPDDPMDLNAAARAALVAMVDHLEASIGLARPAAYVLCSACVDLRVSQAVDVPYPLVSALLPLHVLDEEGARGRPPLSPVSS